MPETEMTNEAARFELIKLARVEMDYLAESSKKGFDLPRDTVDALLMALGALRRQANAAN